MPRYGNFIASSPTSPHTEGENYTIAGKSKNKYYFNLLILGEAPTSTSQPHQYITFYVRLSVTRSIAGIVHPVAMTIDTHM